MSNDVNCKFNTINTVYIDDKVKKVCAESEMGSIDDVED